MSTHPPIQQQSAVRPGWSMDVVYGFWKAMVLKSFIELGIADLIDEKPLSTRMLASATNTQPEPLYRFLRAAASHNFLAIEWQAEDPQETRFTNSELTPSLRRGSTDYFLMAHLVGSFVVDAWNGLTENVRTGERATDKVLGMDLWSYLATHPEAEERFNGSMTALSQSANPLIAASYPFDSFKVLCDIGGGWGSLLQLLLKSGSDTTGIVFDREPNRQKALQSAQAAGLQDRLSFVSGSFFEAITVVADAYILKNVLHDWNDEQTVGIFQRIYAAAPHAHLLIAELIIADERLLPGITGLDLNMLHETGGKQRTIREFEILLREAGYMIKEVYPVGKSPYRLIEAIELQK